VTETSSRIAPHGWRDRLLFLRKFLRMGRGVAAISPSSRWLGRKSLKHIDFDTAEAIVELGAGTGTVTAEIARRLRPETRLLAIELDGDFCATLQRRFADRPNVEIIEADVAKLGELLAERGIEQVDCIISGLPLFYFDEATRQEVLHVTDDALKPGGGFHQITHTPNTRGRYYRRLFEKVRFEYVFLNFPPGGVYFCRGVRPDALQ